MKKLLFAFILLISVSLAHSQIRKGNWMAGGSISFSSENYSVTDEQTTRLTIMPSAGYFVRDKLAGGTRVSFSHVRNRDDSHRDFSLTQFAKYYFLAVDKKIHPFLQVGALWGIEKYKNFPASSKSGFSITGGGAFFLNQFIAIESTIGWESLKHDSDPGRYSTLALGIGFQLHFSAARQKKNIEEK